MAKKLNLNENANSGLNLPKAAEPPKVEEPKAEAVAPTVEAPKAEAVAPKAEVIAPVVEHPKVETAAPVIEHPEPKVVAPAIKAPVVNPSATIQYDETVKAPEKYPSDAVQYDPPKEAQTPPNMAGMGAGPAKGIPYKHIRSDGTFVTRYK
jgi:hypothetical protein